MKGSGAPAKSKKQSPVIEYKWKGINCKRAKGKTGRQAAVATQQAAILGRASGISARIRAAFKPILGEKTNRPVMYRLNNTLQQWLRTGEIDSRQPLDHLNSFNDFYFYGKPGTYDPFGMIKMMRTGENKVIIQVPGLANPAVVDSTPFYGKVNIKICVISCELLNPDADSAHKTEIKITSTALPILSQEVNVPLSPGPSKLLVAAASVNGGLAWIAGTLYN